MESILPARELIRAWDSAAFLVQLSATFGGCLQPNPKTPEHPQDGSQTPPKGGPDTGRPAARRRPSGLRDLQGDEHQPRHAQALAGSAAPTGAARRGEDAGAGEDDRAHGTRRG